MKTKHSKRKVKAHPPPRTHRAASARSRSRVAKTVPISLDNYTASELKDIKFKYLEAMYLGKRHTEILDELKIAWRVISLCLCSDPEFAKVFHEAEVCKNELIQIRREEIMDQRGMEGWLEPVFYLGKKCGSIRRFSDSLILAQSKKAKPLDYAERHVHMGPGGGPVAWANVPPVPTSLTDWEKQVASSLLQGKKAETAPAVSVQVKKTRVRKAAVKA